MKLLTLTLLAATLAMAQTPSGLLTGPVSYVSPLTSGDIYGDNHVWTVAFSATKPTAPPNAANSYTCSASGTGPNGTTIPNCYIVQNIVGVPYSNLQASDGTSAGIPNCYTWDVWQLIMNDVGYCQTSFHGGGSGEQRVALYCGGTVSADMNGHYNLNCQATFGGTAITVIGGVDTPITTVFTVNVNENHHPVWVWIAAVFRTQAHWALYQQVDSMTVGVTPIPGT